MLMTEGLFQASVEFSYDTSVDGPTDSWLVVELFLLQAGVWYNGSTRRQE